MPRNDWSNQLSSCKLLHVVILDLKGVVPTIYQNFFWIIDISHHAVDFKQKIVHRLTLMTKEIKMTIEGGPYEKSWMTFGNIDKNKTCILKRKSGHLCQYFIININHANCKFCFCSISLLINWWLLYNFNWYIPRFLLIRKLTLFSDSRFIEKRTIRN